MGRIGNGHWVNHSQTPLERQQKYWLVRSAGLSCYRAQRMRDWTLSHVEKALGIKREPSIQLLPDGRLKQNSAPVV